MYAYENKQEKQETRNIGNVGNVENNPLQLIDSENQTMGFVDNRPKAIYRRTENKTGLPDGLKTGVESLSGMDMSDVRVHRNSSKPAAVSAYAYTQGTDIHLGPGQERHLPHEAWHAVQQKQGRVRPTVQTAGVNINDGKGLEKEADIMGGRAKHTNVREHTPTHAWGSPIALNNTALSNNAGVIQGAFIAGNDSLTNKEIELYGATIIELFRKLLQELNQPYSESDLEKCYRFIYEYLNDNVYSVEAPRVFDSWLDVLKLIVSHANLEQIQNEDVRTVESMEETMELEDIEDSDEDWTPDEEDLEGLAEDYGYEAGRDYAEEHNAKLPLSGDEAIERFNNLTVDQPSLKEYGSNFWEGYQEGYNEVVETMEELEITDFQAWEKMMTQEELAQLRTEHHLDTTFKSDLDNEIEEHVVYPDIIGDEPQIMVKSNPVPVDNIVNTQTWLGYSVAANLKNLQNKQTAAKNDLATVAGARTKANMRKLRKSLEDIAKILATVAQAKHAAATLPDTDLTNSDYHGSDAAPTEGTHVKAEPLSINSKTPGSPPHDGRLMTAIRHLAKQGAKNESKSYVQMHLLNDLVYGPGELWNLTPGPKKSNSDMEKKVEDPLKRAVLSKGLVFNFEVIVKYNHDPVKAQKKDIDQNPDMHRFQDITFKAEQLEYDSVNNKWVKIKGAPDKDIKAIHNKKINWNYGSLTPLRPKPRILDKKTIDEKTLKSIKVKPAAAKRIVNYVKNDKSAPKSLNIANKKDKLAELVQKYDKATRKPDMNGWSANAVLWT